MLAVAHASGDAINAVLAAAGYNFRRLLAWLRFLWLRILIALGLAAFGPMGCQPGTAEWIYFRPISSLASVGYRDDCAFGIWSNSLASAGCAQFPLLHDYLQAPLRRGFFHRSKSWAPTPVLPTPNESLTTLVSVWEHR
jgi:hypothetical protein